MSLEKVLNLSTGSVVRSYGFWYLGHRHLIFLEMGSRRIGFRARQVVHRALANGIGTPSLIVAVAADSAARPLGHGVSAVFLISFSATFSAFLAPRSLASAILARPAPDLVVDSF